MGIKTCLSWIRRAGAPRGAVAQFRSILTSALQTRGYAARLKAAGLSTRAAIEELQTVEEAQERLPWVSFAEWRAFPQDFENPSVPAQATCQFSYPFRPSPTVVFFNETGALPRMTPEQTLAVPASTLRECAQRIARGQSATPQVAHAILAIMRPGAGCLAARDRDLIWRTLRVPVFEQYWDADGHMMAGECEAHEGLHVAPGTAIFEVSGGELYLTSLAARRRPALRQGTGYRAEIDTEACACGRTEPRLWNLRTLEEEADPFSLAALATATSPQSSVRSAELVPSGC